MGIAGASPGPTRPRRRTVAIATIIVALGLAVSTVVLMGSSSKVAVAPHVVPAAPITVLPTPVTAPVVPVAAATTIAQVNGPLPFSAQPDGPPVGTLPIGSWWGDTKFLPVITRVPGWLQVRLPQRPNGLTAWIPESSATLSTTTLGVVIDVTDHRL